MRKITNEDLGYNSFFEAARKRLGLGDFQVARIISEHRGAYTVKNADGEYLAKITGKQMFNASSREDYPAVGDWVAIDKTGDGPATLRPSFAKASEGKQGFEGQAPLRRGFAGQAVIHAVLSRQTVIKRKSGDKNRAGEKNETQIIAANVNVAFVVESVDRDYNLNRFERYFAIAKDGGVQPAIVLNKTDLLSKEELAEKLTELRSRFPEIAVIPTSAANKEGFDELKKYISKGKTYCFLGSSGVGKSSLINKLLGEKLIKTGAISVYSNRGKHITTARQMYLLPTGSSTSLTTGGIVIDNPGVREVGLTDVGQGVDAFFDEITALARECKYTDCAHTHEPGCAVLEAVKSGKLDKEKYANYLGLKKETDFYELSAAGKREKNRQFGKFKKKALKEIERYK